MSLSLFLFRTFDLASSSASFVRVSAIVCVCMDDSLPPVVLPSGPPFPSLYSNNNKAKGDSHEQNNPSFRSLCFPLAHVFTNANKQNFSSLFCSLKILPLVFSVRLRSGHR